MPRLKKSDNGRRISFSLPESDYLRCKACARIKEQDVGNIIRDIVTVYLTEHKEKFDRAVMAIAELDKMKSSLGKF